MPAVEAAVAVGQLVLPAAVPQEPAARMLQGIQLLIITGAAAVAVATPTMVAVAEMVSLSSSTTNS
jgi:hypothetical protein